MTLEHTVAGQRVLRLLARGTRSDVWLGAGDLVLKVLTPPVPAAAPGREAEALHRARGDHVVELLDVSLGTDAVLVFPRLSRGSLAGLLSRRRSLDAGEAVTILAPIATCLARMHAAGVAHGALSPDAVLFRADGAPVLTGLGSAELFEPGIPEVARERIDGVIADRAALLALADAVLSRTTGERAKAASRLRDGFRAMDRGELAERMASDLFAMAAARPVRFDADEDDSRHRAGRVVAIADTPAPEEPTDPVGRGIAGRLLESGPGSIVRAAVTHRWTSWSAGRRRAVLGGAVAALALLLAFAVVPGQSTSVVPEAVDPQVDAVAPPADAELGTAEGSAIDADDPLAALPDLATRRDGCFRDLSVLCLDGVDEAGSSAWDTDRTALQAITDGGDAPTRLDVSTAELVERIGDSALIDLGPDSDPASVLLLKGEAGWRIRDYLGPGGLGDPEGGS
jgi:tRNA A-37 threonylcarbamoyl transferase component Bud32